MASDLVRITDDAQKHLSMLKRCAASTKWAWPVFDDARLLNLNKKRRETRCVRRCQRGEYDFRAARRTSASRAARRPPCALRSKAAGDLPTQGRARGGSASSRLSTVFRRTASKPQLEPELFFGALKFEWLLAVTVC